MTEQDSQRDGSIATVDKTEPDTGELVASEPNRKSRMFETRREYWALALQHIKELHGPSGPFRNVTTSKEYWMSGFIGISGFSISCEVKMDRAAVFMLLGKRDREKNKAAFDYLFERKAEIESALGTKLDWWRFDQAKASYINYNCKESPVGIYRKDSWETMAKFHAEWSKKFYDVFVPLLHEWNAQQV